LINFLQLQTIRRRMF